MVNDSYMSCFSYFLAVSVLANVRAKSIQDKGKLFLMSTRLARNLLTFVVMNPKYNCPTYVQTIPEMDTNVYRKIFVCHHKTQVCAEYSSPQKKLSQFQPLKETFVQKMVGTFLYRRKNLLSSLSNCRTSGASKNRDY